MAGKNDITLLLGDSLEIMRGYPDNAFDLCLTDPPYGIDQMTFRKNKSRGRMAHTKDYGEVAWDRQIPGREYFDEMRRISKNQIIFGGNYFTDYLSNSSCWLVWHKDNGSTDFADCELAWTSFKTAVRYYRYRWSGMLQEDMKHKETRYHPTQKPLSLMRWCLENYSAPGAYVIDPFMGSGTTMRACKDMNRPAVGIDITPEYVDTAKARLGQEVLF